MIIAVVQEAPKCERTAELISKGLKLRCAEADVVMADPEVCHQTPLPPGTRVAFVAVNTINDVQLLRQIACITPEVARVVVSKSPDYGVEAVRMGAAYYLLEPLCPQDIDEALERCRIGRMRHL